MDFMGSAIQTPIGKIGKNFSFSNNFLFFDVLKCEQHPRNQWIFADFVMYITQKKIFRNFFSLLPDLSEEKF